MSPPRLPNVGRKRRRQTWTRPYPGRPASHGHVHCRGRLGEPVWRLRSCELGAGYRSSAGPGVGIRLAPEQQLVRVVTAAGLAFWWRPIEGFLYFGTHRREATFTQHGIDGRKGHGNLQVSMQRRAQACASTTLVMVGLVRSCGPESAARGHFGDLWYTLLSVLGLIGFVRPMSRHACCVNRSMMRSSRSFMPRNSVRRLSSAAA